MTAFRLHRALPVALAALAAVLSAGCTGGGTGTVKGKITVNGNPLPSGLITFESQTGKKNAYAAAIRDGMYETDQIPSGPCKITVVHSAIPAPESGGNDLLAGRKGGARVAGVVEVPRKYHSSDTSGLELEVKAGANTFDKDLTP
jgi:hypothetical protein